MSENQQKASNDLTARIQADCHPDLKTAFEEWCDKHGYASEAEGLRAMVRQTTGFTTVKSTTSAGGSQ